MAGGLTTLEREVFATELRRVFNPPQAEVLVNALNQVSTYTRDGWATREDVADLKQAFAELATAQARTDASVAELATAQARTDASVKELAAAQARTDASVKELAAAQARTDASVKELAAAQARTEERVGRLEAAMERLAAAQARTEERMGRLEAAMEDLAQAQKQLAQQVGGLSETVGGDIEDIAYIVLHDVLKREFGWKVEPLERTWVTWDGRTQEVNVFGQAHDPQQPQQPIWIVGEAKHNLTLKEVEKFGEQVNLARQNLEGQVFPVCFCYRARPEVQERIRQLGLRLVFSYGKLV